MERRIFLAGMGVGVALALCVAALLITQNASTAPRGVVDVVDDDGDEVDVPRDVERDVFVAEAPSTTVTTEELLALALELTPNNVAATEQAGAQILPTADGHSFYVLWLPEGFDPATDTLVVDLHGHGAFAYDGLAAWQNDARERGYGVLALQWWFGTGDATEDYYTPEQIYAQVHAVMNDLGIVSGNAVLHGFSRGSANAYGVMYYDAEQDEPFFGVGVANAGAMELDYPMYADFYRGRYGRYPMKGTRWILYCGALDETNADACEDAETTSRYLMRFGAVVELFLRDADGGHGDFQLNNENTSVALNVVDDILAEN